MYKLRDLVVNAHRDIMLTGEQSAILTNANLLVFDSAYPTAIALYPRSSFLVPRSSFLVPRSF